VRPLALPITLWGKEAAASAAAQHSAVWHRRRYPCSAKYNGSIRRRPARRIPISGFQLPRT